LVHAYAQAGHRADALGLLEELKRRRRTGYVPAAALILAYLGLGEYDQAFLWLQEAYKEQSISCNSSKSTPSLILFGMTPVLRTCSAVLAFRNDRIRRVAFLSPT